MLLGGFDPNQLTSITIILGVLLPHGDIAIVTARRQKIKNDAEDVMARLIDSLGLKGNPFEHYVAETEPHITDYAVRPPYLEAIDDRARRTSSYVLFGDRGAGKSATRLTIFKELWAEKGKGARVPLAVNMTDFSSVIQGKKLHNLTEINLVKDVAFVVIESLLTWLSSLEEEDRATYLGAMTDEETRLCYELLRDHYLSRPDGRRSRSAREAMELFNQAFIAKSRLWVEQRWDSIANIFGRILDAVSKKHLGTSGSIAADATALIAGGADIEFDSILIVRKLVDLARIFSFSGIVLLIDKVDETEATSQSAEETAALVYPLLARVQLLEIEGFSWIFFLWSRVKSAFENGAHPVRLDKVPHATVAWDDDFLSLMLQKRVKFYSDSRVEFAGLFDDSVNPEDIFRDLIQVSMRSPRELVRLMDVLIREHDILNTDGMNVYIGPISIEKGLDKYSTDVISTVYGERLLAQIFRLNKSAFTNRDVQLTFRVGAQSARTRIQSWQNAGIVKLTGTRADEGASGGRPANEYTIDDARVARIMRRQLVSYADTVIGEDNFSESEE